MERIEGVRLALRLVAPEDAAFIHGLRLDPRYNTHLSAVTGSVADQHQWIERYKVREAAGTEYYYVIERLDNGRACGVVRLYEIEGDQFTWGSWILNEDKPPKAALESAVLSFGAAFNRLNLKFGAVDVRKGNHRALHFYERFNMTRVSEDHQNIYFTYSVEKFRQDAGDHLRAIGAEDTQ
ncbi:GNAT family N-acetyltransferase [Aquicoccus sp. SU-CL01552]|uniref:GNAT family N-acetyltransferase n=1 Tax=Aquicoccus sp. SU-CL01552 TaxID=3127656 RepID=UPI00310259E7